MSNKHKAVALEWLVAILTVLTNPHRAILIPFLWLVSRLGEKADDGADWLLEHSPVFFSEDLEEMAKKAEELEND